MTIAELYAEMLRYPDNEMHDINHLTKVWAYAKTIGELENLDPEQQFVTEAAAILHDIACPALRKQYGHADGKKQEVVGRELARTFLGATDIVAEKAERICFLVGHHHTLQDIDGIDYQILIEADYLVNADESGYSAENIQNMYRSYYKTNAGKNLLRALFLDRQAG